MDLNLNLPLNLDTNVYLNYSGRSLNSQKVHAEGLSCMGYPFWDGIGDDIKRPKWASRILWFHVDCVRPTSKYIVRNGGSLVNERSIIYGFEGMVISIANENKDVLVSCDTSHMAAVGFGRFSLDSLLNAETSSNLNFFIFPLPPPWLSPSQRLFPQWLYRARARLSRNRALVLRFFYDLCWGLGQRMNHR